MPLPGIPTKVERGGDWTLQRLVRETQPLRAVVLAPASEARDGVRVILETKIDALEITILEGGGTAVGRWARAHGFILPPDAPEVLDHYARRSPIFMAARFDADAARQRGQQIGDGTPIHLTIPAASPWVPLRILALGKQAGEVVRADVYLLTNVKPLVFPLVRRGTSLQYSAAASEALLRDLRSDKGMGWLPTQGMWLTHLAINSAAEDLTYDLAVDVSGRPARLAAGLSVAVVPFLALLLVGAGIRDSRRRSGQ